MQDYPTHLFLAHLAATYDQAAYNWKDFYQVDFGLRPYMLWYLAMRLLAGFGTETAGKIIFSLYVLLIALLALAARRVAGKGSQPWGALLLFPFAFNQMYFMGFSNYLISLPLLFLAVLDFDDFAALSSWRIARHLLYLALLMLCHPYTTLVYLALAATAATNYRDLRRRRLLVTAGMVGALLACWFVTQHEASSAPTAMPWTIWWWRTVDTVKYYLLIFTGMRWHGGPDWCTVSLWGAVASCFIFCRRGKNGGDETGLRLLRLYLVILVGFLLLPFWLGYYSFFSARLAPVSYFSLALLLSRPSLSRPGAALLGASVCALLLISIHTQQSLAREAETVLPVLSAAHKNALVLPLVYNGRPQAIDARFFYQSHCHEADYYHLVVGGGANPTLFPNAMMPVQYRPGLHLPYPPSLEKFSWERHGAYYDYLLVRHAPPEVCRALSANCRLVAESGPWKLFGNKQGRKPL